MGQPIGSIVEVTFQGRANSQRTLTILHYRVFAVSSAPTFAQELNGLLNQIGPGDPQDKAAPYLASTASNFTLDNITAQFVRPTRSRRESTAVNANGTLTTASSRPNTAAVITKKTVLAGRKQIGSVHMPGVPDDAATNGLLVTTYRTQLETLAGALLASIGPTSTGGSYEPVIWHRLPAPGLTSDVVTEMTVQDTVRVMRRRTVGVGI